MAAETVKAAFVLGRFLYALTTTEVFAAALDASGRPTTWTSLGARPGFISTSVTGYSADGHEGFLYLTGGGETMTGNLGTCWVARLPGDGTLGAFQETSRIDPGPRYHASTAAAGHVYVVGGAWWSGGSFTGIGTALPFVSVADVRADGTLGAWRRTAMLPQASNSWRVAALGGRLYALLPVGNGIEVLVGDLLLDGSVAGWRRASAQLSQPYDRIELASESGRLYVVGGKAHALGGTNAVAIGRIGPDGDVTGWDVSAADQFTEPRNGAVVAGGNGHLYLVGANDMFAPPPPGAVTEIRWATIDPATGHVAPPDEAPMPQPPGPPRRVHAVPADSGASVRWDPPADDGGARVVTYTISASQGGVQVEVQGSATSARIAGLENGLSYAFEVTARNAAGEGRGSGPSELVTPWPSSTWRPAIFTALQPYARRPFIAGEELFAHNYSRYLVAPLAADGLPWGQIGPGWEGGDSYANFAHFEASAARLGGDGTTCVYYVGGFDGTKTLGTTHVDCVQSDGFRGRWPEGPKISETLAPTRLEGAAIVVEPFLYIAGGTHRDPSGTSDLADVSFARIAVDGTLGPWSTGAALPDPVATPAIAARRGSLYLVAPPGSPSAILRASLRADGSLDGWRLSGAPLPVALAGARAGVLGDFLYVVSAGSPAVLIGRFDSSGSIASWETDPDGSFADPVSDIVTAPGRLYVRSGSGLQMARVDPATGRLLRWR